MIRLDGVDVSHYQYNLAPIRWQLVADAGCWWGATKLTQSTAYLDPTADRSRQSMKAVGFAHVGLYHWLSPTTDPKVQAAWFLQCAGDLAVGEFAMLDAEEAGITVQGVVAWCEAVEAVTQRPAAVYTGAYVSGGTIWRTPVVRRGAYGLRPMILAAYTTEDRAKQICDYTHYPWDAWQFSSDGPVPGVAGRCDMDKVDNRAAFDLACGIGAAAPVEVVPTVDVTPATPIEEDDMLTVFTHSDNDHDGHPARWTYWRLMPDGTKRHVGEVELDKILIGARDGAPALSMADIDTIPDYAAPTATALAALHLTGTVDVRSAS